MELDEKLELNKFKTYINFFFFFLRVKNLDDLIE